VKPPGRLLAGALLLTILSRLAFILLPGVPLETKAVTSIGDSREYIALARNLVVHHTFSRDTTPPFRPELFRTPVYPLFLAGALLVVARPSHPILRAESAPSSPLPFIRLSLFLQLLLSLVTVWLTWWLASELGLSRESAGLAALLVGLSPSLAFLSSKLISEAVFAPLLLVCLLLLNRYRLTGRARDVVGAGICSGLLILTRPIATFFPFIMAIYILWFRSEGRKRSASVRNSFLLLAAASIVVVPWVFRNGAMTGRYIVTTASEHNVQLYDAATVVAAEKHITIPQARDSLMAEAVARYGSIDTTDEATMWQKLAAVSRPHLFRHPELAVPIWLLGVSADFLNPVSVGPLLIHSGSSPSPDSRNLLQTSLGLLTQGRVMQAFSTAWRVRVGGAPLFMLVVLGLATVFNLFLIWFSLASLFLRRTRCLFWLLLPILYFTFVTGTVGDARFRAPIEPLLCMFAAVAIAGPARTPSHRSGLQESR